MSGRIGGLIGSSWKIMYTNYRGVEALRHITIKDVYVGSTIYHPQMQMLMRAYDHDKKEVRDFAVKDVQIWTSYHPGYWE